MKLKKSNSVRKGERKELFIFISLYQRSPSSWKVMKKNLSKSNLSLNSNHRRHQSGYKQCFGSSNL